jgi:hypothetical protein
MEHTNLAAMYQATVYPIYMVIDRDGFIAATQRDAVASKHFAVSGPAPSCQ